MPSVAYLLPDFFIPLLLSLLNKQVRETIIAEKNKGFIYLLGLILLILLAKSFFLAWYLLSVYNLKFLYLDPTSKFYGLSAKLLPPMFYAADVIYWLFIHRLLKITDKLTLVSVMYIFESLWLIFVVYTGSWLISIIIH